MVIVSAAIEAEVSQLADEERREFLEGLGLSDSGLDRVIAAGYGLLGLRTYLRLGRRKPAPGPLQKAPRRRRPQPLFTMILNVASLHVKQSHMMIIFSTVVRPGRKKLAACGLKGGITW